jgi:hypothetical protein
VLTLPVVLTEHVFDKIRSIDMALAEFEQLLGCGEIIEEHETEPGRLKDEPDPDRWSHDYRRRRP